MMKKFIKKVLLALFFILLIGVIFIGYQYIKNCNNEIRTEEYARSEVQLQQELLNKEMENAQNYVNNINNNVALTVLRTSGKLTLSHDKTPKNNQLTEWLFNSDILVYAIYNTAFTIETSSIQTQIDENAVVNIYYNADDIELSLIDIIEFTTSENKSIFGNSYSPEQVAALEQITRDTIMQETNTQINMTKAQNNLESYYLSLADQLNVAIKITEK